MLTLDLPDKLSDLIIVAVEYLEKCEKDPRYLVDMDYWAYKGHDGVCMVCMAGAMIVQQHPEGFKSRNCYVPLRFVMSDRLKLCAINFVRTHRWEIALECFDYKNEEVIEALKQELDDERVSEYHNDPEKHKANMRRAAEILASHGL